MNIVEAAAHREEVIHQIRTTRLERKAAVLSTGNDTDFAAIAQPLIEQPEGIGH